jgi:hypothetical protein
MNYKRLMNHTAVVERYSGSVNAAGDVPYDDDNQWSNQGTIDCRRLTTKAGTQWVAETAGRLRKWDYQVYALPDADVLMFDRLKDITTKPGGKTPATLLDAGPLLITAVTDVVERGLRIKVLEVERVT